MEKGKLEKQINVLSCLPSCLKRISIDVVRIMVDEWWLKCKRWYLCCCIEIKWLCGIGIESFVILFCFNRSRDLISKCLNKKSHIWFKNGALVVDEVSFEKEHGRPLSYASDLIWMNYRKPNIISYECFKINIKIVSVASTYNNQQNARRRVVNLKWFYCHIQNGLLSYEKIGPHILLCLYLICRQSADNVTNKNKQLSSTLFSCTYENHIKKCEHKKCVTCKSNNNNVDITNFHLIKKKIKKNNFYDIHKNRIYIIAQQFRFRLNFCF